MKKKVLILLVLSSLLVQSCYYRYWGSPTYKWKINKNKILSYDYEINLINKPTLYSPIIEINVLKYPFYAEIEHIEYKEYEKKDYKKNRLIIILGVFTPLSILFFSQGRTLGGFSFIALSSILYFMPNMTHEVGQFTGNRKEIKTNNIRKVKSKIFSKAQFKKVKITDHYGNSFYFTTDINGKFKINLIKDFSYTYFKNPTEIQLKIFIDNNFIGKISLNTNDWTVPFLKINKPVPVIGEGDEKEIKLGFAYIGDIYPLLYEGQDLFKIKFNKKVGWIPKDAGQKFWAVPDYAK